MTIQSNTKVLSEIEKLAQQVDGIMQHVDVSRVNNWTDRVIKSVSVGKDEIFFFFNDSRWTHFKVTNENNLLEFSFHESINLLEHLEKFTAAGVISLKQAEAVINYFEMQKIEKEKREELYRLQKLIIDFNKKYGDISDDEFFNYIKKKVE